MSRDRVRPVIVVRLPPVTFDHSADAADPLDMTSQGASRLGRYGNDTNGNYSGESVVMTSTAWHRSRELIGK